MVKYLTQDEATKIDVELFNDYKFSVDQLMELAGLSCASSIAQCYEDKFKRILIICGPGNNGGDGLVCARHLKLFGREPIIYCPQETDKPLYNNLRHQCKLFDIPIFKELMDCNVETNFDLIIDALFGFSFKPPVRPNFKSAIELMYKTKIPIISVDIPSGWDVKNGPTNGDNISPEMLISLTAPKLCANFFNGKFHYLGGRFVPQNLAAKYDLKLPNYQGTDCFVKLK